MSDPRSTSKSDRFVVTAQYPEGRIDLRREMRIQAALSAAAHSWNVDKNQLTIPVADHERHPAGVRTPRLRLDGQRRERAGATAMKRRPRIEVARSTVTLFPKLEPPPPSPPTDAPGDGKNASRWTERTKPMDRTRRERPRVEVADSTLSTNSGLIVAHFDGACVYPRRASCGAVIRRDGRIIWRASQPVVDHGTGLSCNVAEYSGLLLVLNYLLDHGLNHERILIVGDSMMVVKQAFGRWRIKRGAYTTLAREAKQLLTQFPNVTGKWVPRQYNSSADALSKAALAQRWRERQQVD
jgi:ribonuclease HI